MKLKHGKLILKIIVAHADTLYRLQGDEGQFGAGSAGYDRSRFGTCKHGGRTEYRNRSRTRTEPDPKPVR